jgi:hypothetical protein
VLAIFMTKLEEKILLATDYSPWGGGLPSRGYAP